MGKYQITKTTAVDTRQGIVPEKDELKSESQAHIRDVIGLFTYFMRKFVYPDVRSHDETKIKYIDLFHANMLATLNKGAKFKTLKWWNIHVREEPHHALDYRGKDKIHLGHVIHMLCDRIAAGKARSADGQFKYDHTKEEGLDRLLKEAFLNTIDILDSSSVLLKSETAPEFVQVITPSQDDGADNSRDTGTDARLDEESDPENGSHGDS